MIDLIRTLYALRPALSIRTLRGRPIVVGERQSVPLARSISLTFGRPGDPIALGWAWNQPLAVLETWHGRTRRIPIPNLARRITLALVASGLLLVIIARYLGSSGRGSMPRLRSGDLRREQRKHNRRARSVEA